MKLKIIIIFLLIALVCIAGRVEIYHSALQEVNINTSGLGQDGTKIEFET